MCNGQKTGKSHLCAKAENWSGKFILYDDITCIFKFLYQQKLNPLNYFVVCLSAFMKYSKYDGKTTYLGLILYHIFADPVERI